MNTHGKVDIEAIFDIHVECHRCYADLSRIRRHINEHPESLALVNRKGELPLHIFLANNSSIDIALLMMETYPAALQHRNNFGWHCLLIECWNRCRPIIIAKCIELYPEGLAVADSTGFLPLHVLFWNKASSIDDALMMIDNYPAALRRQLVSAELTLHVECKHRCRSIIISKCIELYPEALAMAGRDGNLPLHRLFVSAHSTINDALMMIEKYPAALKRRNIDGEFPIHIECKNWRRSIILSKCIELYHQALDDRAIKFVLWLSDARTFQSDAASLVIVFAACPGSLYQDYDIIVNDVRKDPYCRRKILSLLPRRAFTLTHEADYRDLNWQPRSALMLLLCQLQRKCERCDPKMLTSQRRSSRRSCLPHEWCCLLARIIESSSLVSAEICMDMNSYAICQRQDIGDQLLRSIFAFL